MLTTHPQVLDAAVIGIADEEMGEKVLPVIQPVQWEDAGDALATDLLAYVRARLSPIKALRQIDFMQQPPRHDNGKLYKRALRDLYVQRSR